jgi:hypothetical protein
MPPRTSRTFQDDYGFGKIEEAESHPILNDYFKTTFNHLLDPMSPFDFTTDTIAIEQKARKCNVNTYPDTMIDYRKIENCSLLGYKDKEQWFVFKFYDGLYGIQYNAKKFLKYKKKLEKMPDRANVKEDYRLRVYIPIEDLIQISPGEDMRKNVCMIDDDF